MNPRIPVTVVTGYLGAGKTTLVNHLLKQEGIGRVAVIVNEFGDIGLDGTLIQSGDEELYELSSGCICCVVRVDLIRTLRAITEATPKPDRIVIETTGLANPSPVIQTFYGDQLLAARCRLDAVVTVADALHVAAQMSDSDDAVDQLALASVILLNKARDAKALEDVEAKIRAVNPFAPIHRIDRGRADPGLVLDTGGFDLDRVSDLGPPETNDDHHHDHGPSGITSVTVSTDAPLDADALEFWLAGYLGVHGPSILRTKGIIWAAGAQRKLVIQAVHMLLEGDFTTPWDTDGPHQSHMVFIGRNLNQTELRDGVLSCRATISA
ncbi:GTP-binding protein [Puniceibacterium sp. IMCC21224]|uniref:CobW family GTP-binding protein n=1 Tax=Puniceibacterium sp. IMCC21224 TaxID=1618204 RepID=UPI00064DE00F|nr:GTP-binding protein [Puniceibacterium sp. IMCC21224]KMK65026.1 putative GTPase, G3E family [Puniceibacterium sp. IMCC21224]